MKTWLPPIGWAALIFLGSSLPGKEIPGPVSHASVILHVGEYAILAVLLVRAIFQEKSKLPWWQFVAAVFFLCVSYSFTDELHQAFVPGRNVDGWDMVADAGGTGFGLMIGYWWKKGNMV